MEWTVPEWFSPSDGEYDEAWTATDPDELVIAEVYAWTDSWWWFVKATCKYSEYPEVINCGSASSLDEAKRLAELCVEGVVAGGR